LLLKLAEDFEAGLDAGGVFPAALRMASVS